MSIQDQVSREIEDLHRFFERWLEGAVENNDVEFARFVDVLADDFVLVTPAGQELHTDILVPDLRDMHGKRKGMKLWVEEIQVLNHDDPMVVARYHEHQSDSGEHTRRISTGIFRAKQGLPNDVEWMRVHETWLEG